MYFAVFLTSAIGIIIAHSLRRVEYLGQRGKGRAHELA